MPGQRCRPTRHQALEVALRDSEAARLYAQGLTYREIAERQDVSPAAAHDRVTRALAAVPKADVEALRKTQLDSLFLQKRIVLAVIANPPVKVDHGKVIFEPTIRKGETAPRPMVDRDIQMRASAELRHIEALIARFGGTFVPIVHEIHEVTDDALDAEYRRLVVELGANDTGGEGPGHSPTEAPREGSTASPLG